MQHTRIFIEPIILFFILAPDYDKSCWFDEKHKLGLDFPNVSLIFFERI